MDQTVKFTPLDMQTWPRGQIFYYFSKMAPTGYSLTVDLDVTAMRTALKHAGIKFFPAYLWLVTRTLQMQKDENKPYYLPSVEAGRFYEKDGRIMMPLSITCHHAATDGYHINRFLEALQSEAEAFAEDVPHFCLL